MASEGEAMTEDSMKPFLIVAHKVPVNDRQYATEADAIEDAMALAESSGYTYHVIELPVKPRPSGRGGRGRPQRGRGL